MLLHLAREALPESRLARVNLLVFILARENLSISRLARLAKRISSSFALAKRDCTKPLRGSLPIADPTGGGDARAHGRPDRRIDVWP